MRLRPSRLFTHLIREERGIAIVTAMIVSMVVVTLGATSVSLSLHNSEQSAYDRRNVQSIHAAEAGLNYYYSHLQSGGVDDLDCTISQSLTTTPVARFEAAASFFDASGAQIPCPLRGRVPDSVLITSVGRTAAAPPARTMQAQVRLIPVPGASFGEFAIFSESNPLFTSNIQVFGGEAVEGNVYSNDDVVISSNSTIYGSVEARGSVTLAGNAHVKRSVVAGSAVRMDSNSTVSQNVSSATSSVTMASNTSVFGDVRAATTITRDGTSRIDGAAVSSSPSTLEESRPFPALGFDPLAWQEAGYMMETFSSCPAAKAFISAIPAGNHAVRITAPCDLSYGSNEKVSVRGNLAIVSDGSLTMNSNTAFLNVGAPHTLHLLFGLGGQTPCNIAFRSNSEIGGGLRTVLYTPCTVDMSSNSLVVEGQMFGGSVQFNSNASLTYEPIGVPGYGVTTFEEDILYIREVV
jgi:cytoskeletal protein CcmA (bactofilin family)